MVDVTRGQLLSNSNSFGEGSVTEPQETGIQRIARKYADKLMKDRIADNAAVAALEGMQQAAIGKTVSQIKADTPLFDTFSNINQREEAAKAYYQNNVAQEVAFEVNSQLSKYRDLEPEKARDLIYKDYMQSIAKRTGSDVDTFNAISAGALQHVSKSYAKQSIDYIENVQKKTDEGQTTSISLAMQELSAAQKDYKEDDPVSRERLRVARDSFHATALPYAGQSQERFTAVLHNAALQTALKAGTTEEIQNPDGTTRKVFHGAQTINDFLQTDLYKALPAQEQAKIASLRDQAEGKVLQNLPEEFTLAEADLTLQAYEHGISPNALMRRAKTLNNEWKQKLGLSSKDIITDAEIEQMGRARMSANKQYTLQLQREAEKAMERRQKEQDAQAATQYDQVLINQRMTSPMAMASLKTDPKELSRQYNLLSNNNLLDWFSGADAAKMIRFQKSSNDAVKEIKAQVENHTNILFSGLEESVQLAAPAIRNFQLAKKELSDAQLVDLYGTDGIRKMEMLSSKVLDGKMPIAIALDETRTLTKPVNETSIETATKQLDEVRQGRITGFLGVMAKDVRLPKNIGERNLQLLTAEVASEVTKLGPYATETEMRAARDRVLDQHRVYGAGSSLTSTPLLIRGDASKWEQSTVGFTDGGKVKPITADQMEESLIAIAREKAFNLAKQKGYLFDNDMQTGNGRFGVGPDGKPYVSIFAYNDDGEFIPLQISAEEVMIRHRQQHPTQTTKAAVSTATESTPKVQPIKSLDERKAQYAGNKQSLWNVKQQ